MNFDRNLSSENKELAVVNEENASPRWLRRNVDDKIEASEAHVGSALKAVTKLAQQIVTDAAQCVVWALSKY